MKDPHARARSSFRGNRAFSWPAVVVGMNPRQNTRGARRSKRAESAARRGTIPPPLCPKLTVPVVRDLRHGARSASVLARPVSLRYAAPALFLARLPGRVGVFLDHRCWARESRNPCVRGAGMPGSRRTEVSGRFRVLSRRRQPNQYPKTQTRNVEMLDEFPRNISQNISERQNFLPKCKSNPE